MSLEDLIRYLAAKKSVDDRSLNRHVWDRLVRSLPIATPSRPLRLVEVGAGIGTMIERLLERRRLSWASITALDVDAGLIAEAARRLPEAATRQGFAVSSPAPNSFVLRRATQRIEVELITAELSEFLARWAPKQAWDLLLAHALLDVVDVSGTLPRLLAGLRPGGLCYFTINFDGVTSLEPPVEPAPEARIEAIYHRMMDERRIAGRSTGGSRTGRQLIGQLRRAGGEHLAAGGSDWVVCAGEALAAEGYAGDEAYFVQFIIETICQSLAGYRDLPAAALRAWRTERLAQIERG